MSSLDGWHDGAMPVEYGNELVRFFRDFSQTNDVITDAEEAASEDPVYLQTASSQLKEASRRFLETSYPKIKDLDFEKIYDGYIRRLYHEFQNSAEVVNVYWKRYTRLRNRLDMLPANQLESGEYDRLRELREEHDNLQAKCKRLNEEYRHEQSRLASLAFFKPVYILMLVAKLEDIAESIIEDLKEVAYEK